MYSGSDSTESQTYPQWALNPSTYQNMSNEQVDWAALAQQWIIMKEAGPPPVISSEKATKNEGGEAPMDVEDKDESLEWNPQNEWGWNAQNQSWGWTPPMGVPPPVALKPPLLPTPANFNYNAPPESVNDNANFTGYSTVPQNDYSSGYWTSAGSSKQVKPHNRRFSKVNVPRPVQPLINETQPTLDATKRKQLPAWIREGLEKMERDKQKQLEREKEKQEREEYNEKMKQSEKETMEILKSTIKEQQKCKFESDVESEEEDKKAMYPEPVLTPAEQMMNVRRTMTEILLKVTNREIENICREELQRYHKKHKASDRRVSAPSGANVTTKLGLGIYGGSESSSSDNSGDEKSPERKDSDTELKDSIKRKKAEFSKTEREIEDKLAMAAEKKQSPITRSPTPETKDNHNTQVDTKSQGRKQSTKKRVRSSSSSSSRSRSTTPEKSRRKKRYSRRSRSRSRSSSYRRRRSRSRRRSRRSRSRSGGRGKRSRRR
ncbi:arginine/serine-rich protein PNISR-like [Tribolium madens]|uniref:arginine/serine-rich protein PNISR-like n=1 Tax=Tribolium madens TaxID=41895 RepID=UPI001CF7647C|nr:arginine/serine-rich protein PNISR-like [Tribolium madens]